MKKPYAIIATSLLAFSISASAADDGTKAAINAANSANGDAKSVGYEWRDTGKMIKKAEKLAKEGKTEAAIKLAKQAEMQGKAAQLQATSQKSAGPRF